MDQQEIRKLFKKYDVDFQGRKYLLSELLSKTIMKRTIRNMICQQNEPIQSVYCLLKGSVQVYHILSVEMKQKLIERNNEQQVTEHKSPRFNHQRIVFSSLQSEFQLINGQSLLTFLQMQQQRQTKNANKNIKRRENDSKRQYQVQIKQYVVKSRYSAIVTSSECEYIELTFPQAKAMLKDRIQYINRKESQRKKLIQQIKSRCRVKNYYNEQQTKIHNNQNEKIMQNLNSPIIGDEKTIQKLSLKKNGIEEKEKMQKSTYQMVFSRSGGKRHKSISLISLNHTEKTLPKKDEALPLLNNFKNQLDLSNQNQLILQRYRSKKAFEKLCPLPQSQNQKILYPIIKADPVIKPNSESQDRLFKQNLKKIIRKKLNFQKKYGQTIKQCEPITTIPPKILNFEQLQNNNRTQIAKSYSIDKLKILEIKRTNCINGAKFNTFGVTEKKIQQEMPRNKLTSELQPSLNEFIELQKMKKKLEEERLFLKLQNLDSYFDKIE